MFNTLKTIFQSFGFTGEEEKKMFSIGKSDQGFFIADRHGITAEGTGFYTRRRDAVRGAARRGLTLA